MKVGHSITVLLCLSTINSTCHGHATSHINRPAHKRPLDHRPMGHPRRYHIPAFKPLRLNHQPMYIPLMHNRNHKRLYRNKNKHGHPKLISTKLNMSIDRKKETFENFVTPKIDLPRKRYEVTTEKFEDNPPDPSLDSDLTSDIDEDDDSEFNDNDYERPQVEEYSDPGRPLDSYGRPYGVQGEAGSSYGRPYGVQEEAGSSYGRPFKPEDEVPRTYPGYSYKVYHTRNEKKRPHRIKKPAGRVRMQVFRGPTRYSGHKPYAQWGFYVVQPAVKDTHGHT